MAPPIFSCNRKLFLSFYFYLFLRRLHPNWWSFIRQFLFRFFFPDSIFHEPKWCSGFDFSGFENAAVSTTQFPSRDDCSRLCVVFDVTVNNRRRNVCGVVSTLLRFRLLISNEGIYEFRVIKLFIKRWEIRIEHEIYLTIFSLASEWIFNAFKIVRCETVTCYPYSHNAISENESNYCK